MARRKPVLSPKDGHRYRVTIRASVPNGVLEIDSTVRAVHMLGAIASIVAADPEATVRELRSIPNGADRLFKEISTLVGYTEDPTDG